MILPAFNFLQNKRQITSDLENNNITVFDELFFEPEQHQNHSVFTLYSSKRGEHFLTIDNNRAKVDRKGKVTHKTENIIEYIALNKDLKEKLFAKISTTD